MKDKELYSLHEAYLEVYQQLDEKEDSPYEKASDAALDARYGYGRAQGDKRSFGRAANRSSAAAALRAIRRGERSGSGTSREAGADAVHQGWSRTAKTSTDQTPEKKAKRAALANTSYSNLPDDEKEKDRVSFDAVRATYNRNKTRSESFGEAEQSSMPPRRSAAERKERAKELKDRQTIRGIVSDYNKKRQPSRQEDPEKYYPKEEVDIYDIILSHLLDEGYAETSEAAEVIMVNMSEEWRGEIITERTRQKKIEGKPRPDPSSIGHRVMMDVRNRNKEGLMTKGGQTVAQHERKRGVKKVRTGRVEPKKPAVTPAEKLAFRKDQEEKRRANTERMMSSRFD